jgi:hypothetical protein
MATVAHHVPDLITQAKASWAWLMSLNRATHVKFSLSANDKIDYMLALVQLGSAWTVTIITGAGTYLMVSQGMQQYNPAPWLNYAISGVIAFLMWLITDLALGNFIEIVVHNTVSVFFKPFWTDFKKTLKRKPKNAPAAAAAPAPGVLTLSTLANPQSIAQPKAEDTPARYSLTSRIIQLIFTLALAKGVWMFYSMDYTAVKTIQQPVADVIVQDTSRNLEAERKAIIAQTQPNIDRLVKEIAKLEDKQSNAWKYSVNHPSMAEYKKLLPKDKGWARAQIEAKFYNKYKSGIDQKLEQLIKDKREYEADQKETLSAINAEVNDFNTKNRKRVDNQTALIFTSIFALGFMAKQAYGGAVALRTLWYMSETNGGIDVDGDGKVTRKDMHAYQSGQRPTTTANSSASTPTNTAQGGTDF